MKGTRAPALVPFLLQSPMTPPAWILLGMMGSGKSTVGRHLAEHAERTFKDTDTLLEHRFGRPVHQIFSLYGEEAFRQHETSILKTLDPGPFVIATGGGIVLRPENWDEIRRIGKTIFLDVPVEILQDRLAKSRRRRPLLETDAWEDRLAQMLDSRRDLYLQADLHFQVESESLEDCAMHLFEFVSGANL